MEERVVRKENLLEDEVFGDLCIYVMILSCYSGVEFRVPMMKIEEVKACKWFGTEAAKAFGRSQHDPVWRLLMYGRAPVRSGYGSNSASSNKFLVERNMDRK